jgi:hypothetical protein
VHYTVRVDRSVLGQIDASGLTADEQIRILERLQFDLAEHGEDWLTYRAFDTPGCCAYHLPLESDDGATVVRCRFVVDDSDASGGNLLVKGFSCERKPMSGE